LRTSDKSRDHTQFLHNDITNTTFKITEAAVLRINERSIQFADTSHVSDEDTVSTQSSLTFNRYPCFVCLGTIPVEIQMKQTVFHPSKQIELFIKLNEVQNNITRLKVSLMLDLQIVSVVSGKCLNRITEELASEIFT
jgi:hypothetical protein